MNRALSFAGVVPAFAVARPGACLATTRGPKP